MLEILAIAPEDGWAYVRTGNQIRLVRPPYTDASASVVSQESVDAAISRHGYVEPEHDAGAFADWSAVISFLNTRAKNPRQTKGIETSNEIIGEELPEFAAPAAFSEFLERIESELISDGKLDHAENLLLKILMRASFRKSDEHCRRAVDLLDAIKTRRKGLDKKRGEMAHPSYAQFDMWRTLASIKVRMYVKDAEHRFVFINQACADDLRLNDPLEAIGKTNHDFFVKECADRWAEEEARIIKTREPMLDKEEQEIWPDAEVKWLVTSKFPLYNHAGDVTGIFGISTDITDRKRELMRYELAVDGARDGLWHLYRQPAKDVWFSARWKEMLGYQDAEIPHENTRFWKLVHPDDRFRVRETIDQHLSGNTSEYECEFRMKHKSNGYRWIRARGMATFEDGVATAFAGSHTDITELMEAEQKRRESEAFYLKILDTIPGFVSVKDHENRFIFVNKAIAEAFGASKTDILGKTDDDFLEDREQVVMFREGDRRVLEGVRVEPREESFREHRLRTIKVPLLAPGSGGDGSMYVLGVSTDITDLYMAREELEHERDLLHNLMEHSPDAIFFKDTEHRFTRVNRELARLVGMDKPEDLVGKTDEEVFDQTHKLNTEYARTAIKDEEQVLRTGAPSLNREALASTVDGPRWRQVSKVPILGKDGKVESIVGISRDIDKLKRLNDKLQEQTDELTRQKELFEQIMAIVPHYIFVKDRQSRFIKVSTRFAERHDCNNPADMFGKTDDDYFPPEVAKQFRIDDEEVMLHDSARYHFQQTQPYLGRTAILETSKIPLHDADGAVIGLLGVYEDVTHRDDRVREEFRKSVNQSLAHFLGSRVTILEQNMRGLRKQFGDTPDMVRLSKAVRFLKDATFKAASLAKLGEASEKKEEFDLIDLARRIVDIAADTRVKLIPPAPNRVLIVGSKFHFENAFSELLRNSQDFTPESVDGGEIRIMVQIDGLNCELHVVDNGPGVPPHLKGEILFELFQSSPKNRSGMGLNYVQRVVEFHGGKVQEIGPEGGGAHFVIAVPFSSIES